MFSFGNHHGDVKTMCFPKGISMAMCQHGDVVNVIYVTPGQQRRLPKATQIEHLRNALVAKRIEADARRAIVDSDAHAQRIRGRDFHFSVISGERGVLARASGDYDDSAPAVPQTGQPLPPCNPGAATKPARHILARPAR